MKVTVRQWLKNSWVAKIQQVHGLKPVQYLPEIVSQPHL